MMHPPRVPRRPTKRSLTVRFPVPRAAAAILRSMAVSKDPRLLELGVLAVKFKDNESIALGLEVGKGNWKKDKSLAKAVQRSSTSEILSHFNSAGVVFSSNLERSDAAGKHNKEDVIYAGNGSCSDNSTAAAEKKASQLLKLDASNEGSFISSDETRSSVVNRQNFSRDQITRKEASDLQSESTTKKQSNMPAGRILPPLPRRNKRESGSPDLIQTKSEVSKRGTQPMLDIFFDQGRFSAANMLMQLAKNHTSKESSEQEREHSTVDTEVMTTSISSVSSNKTSIVTQACRSPNRITHCQDIAMELMQDKAMGCSDSVKSNPPDAVLSKLTKGGSRTKPIHFERNETDIVSKSQSIYGSAPVSQVFADNVSSHVHSTTTWSGLHSSPIHLANSRATQPHMDSTPAQTIWSNSSGLSNSRAAHVSLEQMSKGNADTKMTWSNPSVRPHSRSHSLVRQTSNGSGDTQTTWTDPGVLSNSPTDALAETGRGESTLTTWSSNPGTSSNAVNIQPQLGLYQQNIARYPVSYVTYPLGFVYPYIALPQGVNTAIDQETKVKDEAEKKGQSDVKPLESPKESVLNHTMQGHDSSTKAPSTSTSTVQWVIPQVQTGNTVQQGQFIDLASSLRYWQQLSLIYRSQIQAAAAQALAGNLQYKASNTSAVTSSTTGCSQNDVTHPEGGKLQESKDFNNNFTDGCDKSAGKEVNKSQAEVVGLKCQNYSLSGLKQLSSDPQHGKSDSVRKLNSNLGRSSVIHVVETDEGSKALDTCKKLPSSSDHRLWTHAATSLSGKLERMEDWSGSSISYSPTRSITTSSSDDNSSPALDTKELFHPTSKFGEAHGLLRGVKQSSAPELSFVHENSIAYMNVRSHCGDYATKELKKSASRSDEGVRPAKRKKSKKSL